MPLEVIQADVDNYRQIKVSGKSRLPVKIHYHEFKSLPNADCVVRISCIEGSTISRDHSDKLREISCTIRAADFFTEEFATLSYGANPRLPVLCNTFDDIFETAEKGSPHEELFVLHNTGIDVFCEMAEFDSEDNKVTLKFDHETQGIANGGLTTGVLRWMIEKGWCKEDVKLSIRIWAISTDIGLIESASTARNSHRELDLLDRMNQLGAFEHLITQLGDYSGLFRFKVGDQNAVGNARNGAEICQILYMFNTESAEAHPVWKHNPPGGALQTFKKDGRNKSPNKGLNELKKSVNI